MQSKSRHDLFYVCVFVILCLFIYVIYLIGTSTGAAISLFLVSGKCLHCCRTLLFRFKNLVFCGKRPYPPEPLEMLMRDEFGDNTVMTDLKTVR